MRMFVPFIAALSATVPSALQAAANDDTVVFFCELQKVDGFLTDHPKVHGPVNKLDFVAVMKPNAPFVGNVLKTRDPDGLLPAAHFGGITSVEKGTFQFYSGTPGASDYRMLNLWAPKGKSRRAVLGSTAPEFLGSCTSTGGEPGLALFENRLEGSQ